MSNALVRRRSVASFVLCALVKRLAPASRLLTPSANRLITYSNIGHCRQPRFILDFRSDGGKASAQGWYSHQDQNTRFNRLEYRKDKEASSGTSLLLARDSERGHVLRDEGAAAEDSAHVLSSFETEYKELLEQTEVLLTINLTDAEDLGVILAVCEGVQMHAKAVAYNLMRYNCYFFSWMIVAAIARRTYNWENVLSKEGWEDILQTSLKPTLPDFPVRLNPVTKERPGAKIWFSRVISKLRTQSQIQDISHAPTSIMEEFQAALRTKYSNSHGSIESVISKLLLRSQLGPALKEELIRIESSNFASAIYDAAVGRIRKTILQADTLLPILCLESLNRTRRPSKPLPFPHINRYRYSQVMCASKAAAQVLRSGNKNELPSGVLKDVWMEAWCRAPSIREQYEWLEDKQAYIHIPPPQLAASIIQGYWRERRREPSRVDEANKANKSSEVVERRGYGWGFLGGAVARRWGAMGEKALPCWESAWDEYSQWHNQYATSVTAAVTNTLLERLGDMASTHLVFGSNIEKKNGQKRGNNIPSLQDFIRSRMQEHFQLVEKVGFGSFQELISSAEMAMCEIWVTSLDIIESSRYQPQYTTNHPAD